MVASQMERKKELPTAVEFYFYYACKLVHSMPLAFVVFLEYGLKSVQINNQCHLHIFQKYCKGRSLLWQISKRVLFRYDPCDILIMGQDGAASLHDSSYLKIYGRRAIIPNFVRFGRLERLFKNRINENNLGSETRLMFTSYFQPTTSSTFSFAPYLFDGHPITF